jgi:hypothetical protein
MAFDPFRGYVAGDPASIYDVQRRQKLADQLAANKVQNGSLVGILADTLAGTASGYENSQAAAEGQAGLDDANSALARALSGEADDPASLISAASNPFLPASSSGLVGDLLKKKMGIGSETPSSVKEWEYFNALSPEDQAAYLRMKRSTPYLNTGESFVQPNPAAPGEVSGDAIPIDNYTPKFKGAQGTVEGTTQGTIQAEAGSLESKLPGLKSVVNDLAELADKATYTQTGQLWDAVVRETGQMPPEGAIARTKYLAMVDNQVLPLLRDTFGAAFTEREGETLRATLGAPDKSPIEKKAVLEAFINQKVRDLQALQSRLATDAPAGGDPAAAPPAKVLTFNPATGELE